MSEIINLRRARKAKARSAAEAEAAANRTRFGRTKAEKAQGEAERAALLKATDQAKLTDG